MSPLGHIGPSRQKQTFAGRVTEKALQQTIIDAATLLGYRHFHAFDMRRSDTGFPDLLLIRPRDGRRYALELKTAAGKATPAQLAWLQDMAACGIPAMLVRPDDLDDVLAMLQ